MSQSVKSIKELGFDVTGLDALDTIRNRISAAAYEDLRGEFHRIGWIIIHPCQPYDSLGDREYHVRHFNKFGREVKNQPREEQTTTPL